MSQSPPEISVSYAIEEDIPHIVEMARQFFEMSPYSKVDDWNPLRATETVTGTINSPDGIILVARVNNLPVGFLMACSHIPMWSYNPMAMEMAYWVEPSLRDLGLGLSLCKEYHYWCEEKNITTVCMGTLPQLDTDLKLGGSLIRAGFSIAETVYVRTT